jgi:hypothetical protein
MPTHAKPAHSAAILTAYDRVIATQPGVIRKGATIPYTSLNGNMSGDLDETKPTTRKRTR